MEDVQDLVEIEMPDHLEERGEDEDAGAGQPGERRPDACALMSHKHFHKNLCF